MARKKEAAVEETETIETDEIPVEKEAAVEETAKPLYELAHEDTQFYDRGFLIRSGEQKELPENPSARLLDRIKAGFIIEVK